MSASRASFYVDAENLNYGQDALSFETADADPPPAWKRLRRLDGKKVMAWLAWEKGLTLRSELPRYAKYRNTLDSGAPAWNNGFLRWNLEAEYIAGGRWWLAGAGLIYHRGVGALSDSLLARDPEAYSSLGWRAILGLPGLRYEIGARNWEVPEYGWMERDLPHYARLRRSGQALAAYDDRNLREASPYNLYHAVSARFGVFRYHGLLDRDVYHHAIHEAGLDGLPMPLGQWGLGLVTDLEEAYPRLTLAFRRGFSPFRLGGKPFGFDWTPLEFNFSFRDKWNYMVSLTTGVRLEDPLRSLWGG